MNRKVVRIFELARCLSSARYGIRSVDLAERLGVSRATIDRHLAVLREAGVAIESVAVNGEVKHRLAERALPPLSPTPLQHAALQLARWAVGPLEGTELVRVLDELLRQSSQGPRGDSSQKPSERGETPSDIELIRRSSPNRDAVFVLDSAIRSGHQVRFVYRSARGAGRSRVHLVDPLALRFVEGDVYLGAFDGEEKALRRFKVTRIEQAEYLPTRVGRHSPVDEEALFGRAIKAWGGPSQSIAVRLNAEVAHLAREYPLQSDQRCEAQADGSVIIRAVVSGLVEAKQWLLRWGAAAQAIEPRALREMMQEELGAAWRAYAEEMAIAVGDAQRVMDMPHPQTLRKTGRRSEQDHEAPVHSAVKNRPNQRFDRAKKKSAQSS